MSGLKTTTKQDTTKTIIIIGLSAQWMFRSQHKKNFDLQPAHVQSDDEALEK